MSQLEIDKKRLIQDAIVWLENKFQNVGEGRDENLQMALEILRQHEPAFSISRPSIPEATESERKVFALWNSLVEPEIARHAQPTRIRNGTLFIAVDDPIWLNEIVRYWRKTTWPKFKAALPPGIVSKASYRYQPCAEIHFEFVLPQPLFGRSATLQGSWEVELEPGGHFPAQQYVRDALEAVAKGIGVQVSFKLAPADIPFPHHVSTPKSEHFVVCGAAQTLEAHYFGQLHLDLDWAADAARAAEREGFAPLTARANAFRAIAGQRWGRFKTAQAAGERKEASEMHAFAQFWYRLAEQIEPSKPE